MRLRDVLNKAGIKAEAREFVFFGIDRGEEEVEWRTEKYKVTQQFGRSFEELKEQKKRELLAQRVIGYEVVQKISVPEADLQKYYDEHKAQYMRDEEVFLSQILISTEGKTRPIRRWRP